MTQQLADLGLEFERIEAVDGAKINPNNLAQYQQQSKKSYLHYASLSAAEIGCAMSWHKAWELVSGNNHPASIVLEDDVKLAPNFQATINALSADLDENIIIDLSGKKGTFIVEKKTIGNIKLIRYQTPPLKNQGAIYGKSASKKFSQSIQNFKAPVDTLQQMLWQHGIKTWSLAVGCLSHQDFALGGSTISTSKKPFTSKLKKELSRPLWRSWIVLKNAVNNS